MVVEPRDMYRVRSSFACLQAVSVPKVRGRLVFHIFRVVDVEAKEKPKLGESTVPYAFPVASKNTRHVGRRGRKWLAG